MYELDAMDDSLNSNDDCGTIKNETTNPKSTHAKSNVIACDNQIVSVKEKRRTDSNERKTDDICIQIHFPVDRIVPFP